MRINYTRATLCKTRDEKRLTKINYYYSPLNEMRVGGITKQREKSVEPGIWMDTKSGWANNSRGSGSGKKKLRQLNKCECGKDKPQRTVCCCTVRHRSSCGWCCFNSEKDTHKKWTNKRCGKVSVPGVEKLEDSRTELSDSGKRVDQCKEEWKAACTRPPAHPSR